MIIPHSINCFLLLLKECEKTRHYHSLPQEFIFFYIFDDENPRREKNPLNQLL